MHNFIGRCGMLLTTLSFIGGSQALADDVKPKAKVRPKPVPIVVLHNPAAKKILDLPGSGVDESKIDYTKLPRIKGTPAVISRTDPVLKFQLHDYLLHHDGQYWAMWSQGPPTEDEPTQHVRYATSPDGLKWSESQAIVAAPKAPYAYIARGLWVRDGELLALIAHFKGKGAFGANKELKLEAHVWNAAEKSWKLKGIMYDNAINNFPPEKLSSGEWMTTRRDPRFNVTMLIGGVKSYDDWQVFPVVKFEPRGFRPDEPIWYQAANKSLVALFRDNSGSNHLFHATSNDQGRTWSAPEITNFPNSPSKIFSLQTSLGCRVLISNANPKVGRQFLYLSLTEDGLTYTRMAVLEIPTQPAGGLQYPHAIEHDGHLLIAFSRKKVQSELLKIPLSEIQALRDSNKGSSQP